MRRALLRLRWLAGGCFLALAICHFVAALLAWKIAEVLQHDEASDYDFMGGVPR
jgi:hypothetical protein